MPEKEEELIRIVSRTELDETLANRFKEIVSVGADWDRVIKLCEEDWFTPLLYHHLKSQNLIDAGIVPDEIVERLKSDYYNNSLMNMLLVEECGKILKILAEKKIGAMVLKGIFFAENFYKNIALRPVSDIDLLVKMEHIGAVNDILVSLGYLSPANYPGRLACAGYTHTNSLVYNKPGAYHFVHLHWHIINLSWPVDSIAKAIDMNAVWRSAKKTRIGKAECLKLAPHHELIYMAHHGFSHFFRRAILATDIYEFLKAEGKRLDWSLVASEARRFRLSLALYLALLFTTRRFDMKLPELESLRPPRFGLPERLIAHFVGSGKRWYWLYYATYLLGERGFSGRISFLKKTLFPSKTAMAHGLGVSASDVKTGNYIERLFK